MGHLVPSPSRQAHALPGAGEGPAVPTIAASHRAGGPDDRHGRSGTGLPMGHPAHSAYDGAGPSFAAIRSLASPGEGLAVIRIEIGAMPPLLRSIVSSALETERDLVVMAPATAEERTAGEADVLIVCSDRAPNNGIPVRQLARIEAPAIVAIDSEGVSATILRVTAESTPIAAASDLCEAVRLAARHRSRTTN